VLLDAFRTLGVRLSRFTERWAPDSRVICMILTSVALALACFTVTAVAMGLVSPDL
jgi:short subunit fatty acids transporter